MIFMGMGDNEAMKAFTVFGNEANVRHDHINAGVSLIAKLHTKINHQPIARVGRANTIAITVHADFADTAQRQQDEAFTQIVFAFLVLGLLLRLFGCHCLV